MLHNFLWQIFNLAKIILDPDNEHRITFTFIVLSLYKIENKRDISCFYFCYISAVFGPKRYYNLFISKLSC